MKKRYIALIILLVFITVNMLGVNFTSAWFVSGGNIGNGEYYTGIVNYKPDFTITQEQKSIYGSLIDGIKDDTNIVYLTPGDEIIKPFVLNDNTQTNGMLSIENFSTVPTNVRAVINCEIYNNQTKTYEENNAFTWQRIGTTDEYQYGKTAVIDGVNVHMGLISTVFSNKAINATIMPDDYIPPNNTNVYNWNYISEEPSDASFVSFKNSWDLKIADNNQIPQINTNERICYNVIESMKIVGEHPDKTHQQAFNSYFSKNYSGMKIKITISYYAKQLMGMQWNMFEQNMITIGS
ncbi:MAG: hypothetical protein RR549_01395 [Oscillospiraceae bacterium]